MPKIPVTVWTTPNCVQCASTKRMMDRLGIHYLVEDLTAPKNAAKLAEFKEKGHTTAPIVTTDIKMWSGFRHNKIEGLAQYLFGEKKDIK